MQHIWHNVNWVRLNVNCAGIALLKGLRFSSKHCALLILSLFVSILSLYTVTINFISRQMKKLIMPVWYNHRNEFTELKA